MERLSETADKVAGMSRDAATLVRVSKYLDRVAAMIDDVLFELTEWGVDFDRPAVRAEVMRHDPYLFIASDVDVENEIVVTSIGDIDIAHSLGGMSTVFVYKDRNVVDPTFVMHRDIWETSFTVEDVRNNIEDFCLFLQWVYATEIIDLYGEMQFFPEDRLSVADIRGMSPEQIERRALDIMRQIHNETGELTQL